MARDFGGNAHVEVIFGAGKITRRHFYSISYGKNPISQLTQENAVLQIWKRKRFNRRRWWGYLMTALSTLWGLSDWRSRGRCRPAPIRRRSMGRTGVPPNSSASFSLMMAASLRFIFVHYVMIAVHPIWLSNWGAIVYLWVCDIFKYCLVWFINL